MTWTESVDPAELHDLEQESKIRSFALDEAWAEAAATSGFATPRWLSLKEDGLLRAVILGLSRERGGFSKVVCGSNGGVGILSSDLQTAIRLVNQVRQRWRPSVLQIFASQEIPQTDLRWEPSYTLHVSLEGSLEEIKGRLSKRARNSLSRAIRSGVKGMSASRSEEKVAIDMLESTSITKGFPIPPKSYLSALHSTFGRSGLSVLAIAKAEDEILCVVHVLGARGVASWWKGGSSADGYRLNASLVAHWTAIQIAKERGFKVYDLGGTHPTNPAYASIHRFKSSLGGQLVLGSLGRRSTLAARAARWLSSL